jgi:acetyl-CoA carboxylase biotin carboxylase subunit
VHIGPAVAAESYLMPEKIIEAARATGADAIHPGYGFLSENAGFATALAEAGLTFIGPPASAIELMGSKTEARTAMAQAEVPTVPGAAGPEGKGFATSAEALSAANEIGFPVLIKAAAGGGGKGMRLVASGEHFEAAFDGARREAAGAFGDDTVYVEKAIIRPRHVEVQVFADEHGNVVHLGERDCSIQRRHQKVIEEAPCPVLSDQMRADMGAAAVKAARACDYRGAGTVEFLYDGSGFYFLEMNTRLQVEHPVTEMIYGVDLVGWQLDVAAGKPLPMDQADLDARRHGAAIECRVYAEDHQRFLPSPGKITKLRVPSGPYVRDDSGVYEGWEVPVYYDPLLSKLVTWGDTRAEALGRMRRALSEYAVGGIRTNLPLHRRILAEPSFESGEYDTGYIERFKDEICAPADGEDDERNAAIAALLVSRTGEAAVSVGAEDAPAAGISAWRRQRGWRRL